MRAYEHAPADGSGATPIPREVSKAFSCYVGDVVLAVAAAATELSFHAAGPAVLIGAAIEAVWFLGLGAAMRLGKQWARMALMGASWMFVAINAIAVFQLNNAFGKGVDGWTLLSLACTAGKLLLILGGIFYMYRPKVQEYFQP